MEFERFEYPVDDGQPTIFPNAQEARIYAQEHDILKAQAESGSGPS